MWSHLDFLNKDHNPLKQKMTNRNLLTTVTQCHSVTIRSLYYTLKSTDSKITTWVNITPVWYFTLQGLLTELNTGFLFPWYEYKMGNLLTRWYFLKGHCSSTKAPSYISHNADQMKHFEDPPTCFTHDSPILFFNLWISSLKEQVKKRPLETLQCSPTSQIKFPFSYKCRTKML